MSIQWKVILGSRETVLNILIYTINKFCLHRINIHIESVFYAK